MQKRTMSMWLWSIIKTFMNQITELSANVELKVQSILADESFIVACTDNGQKRFPKKNQWFGTSNKFVKVTASIFKQSNPLRDNTPILSTQTNTIYTDQAIPSPFGMAKYESIKTSNEFVDQLQKNLNLVLICTLNLLVLESAHMFIMWRYVVLWRIA